ncbi:MAG: hypothetical protein M3Q97_09900, partial [Bacteroidota bacterium]|nr:hypothetical protein [Bacteroidota bacterium]
MKTLRFTLLLIGCGLLSSAVHGQVSWLWHSANKTLTEITASHTDKAGNTYISGLFQDSVIIGADSFRARGGTFDHDLFLAVLDKNGIVKWARHIGSTVSDGATGISADANGNIYLFAGFGGDIYIDNNLALSAAGNTGIIKFDGAGRFLWATKSWKSPNAYFIPKAMAMNNTGRMIVAGQFKDSISFGGDTVYEQGGLFFAAFDTAGNSLWLRSASSTLQSGSNIS